MTKRVVVSIVDAKDVCVVASRIPPANFLDQTVIGSSQFAHSERRGASVHANDMDIGTISQLDREVGATAVEVGVPSGLENDWLVCGAMHVNDVEHVPWIGDVPTNERVRAPWLSDRTKITRTDL